MPQSYEDYPFDDVTPVIRHAANKKMFALVGETDGRLSISLKCDPFEADLLRQTFKDVNPGYHLSQRKRRVAVGTASTKRIGTRSRSEATCR
ncbi:hypothetical protein FACS189490_12830 [Clostridia bacterium]|nr:hypothetical protein FACS189490_12830 [Clostridia bacterium]